MTALLQYRSGAPPEIGFGWIAPPGGNRGLATYRRVHFFSYQILYVNRKKTQHLLVDPGRRFAAAGAAKKTGLGQEDLPTVIFPDLWLP
jgi:hypothetical protein